MTPIPISRPRELARWAFAGALLGLLLGLAHAPHPWSGQAGAVFAEAAIGAVLFGLTALGACWLSLKRRGA